MSRYFKYKGRQALVDDARVLGLEILLEPDLSPLREATVIGGTTVGNRLAIQPMEGCDANLDGTPSELTLRRYRRFGAGGAKLIWGEACAITPEGRANPRQLLIEESTALGLEQLLTTCRRAHVESCGSDHGLVVGLQLTHSGRYSCHRPVLAQHDPLLDPRTIVDRTRGVTASDQDPLISDAELDRLLDRYVTAASLAYRIGFDFVDLKQCHRYLLNELLAARTPSRQVRRFVRESHAVHSRAGGPHPRRPSRAADRDPHQSLRRHPVREGSGRTGSPRSVRAAGALVLGHVRGRSDSCPT